MAVEEHEKLSPRLVYEIIRRDGIEELNRPTKALIFSGITAGVIISFSFVFKAILTAYLPADALWVDLVTNMGYTVGFVLVIIGHMQLLPKTPLLRWFHSLIRLPLISSKAYFGCGVLYLSAI